MFARSTAWRQGEGRTWTKNTSISRSWPSCTIRFAGLMSRCARPTSHIWRTSCSPWSITMSSDLGVADLHGALEELHHDHVLALRRDLDDAVGLGRRKAVVVHQPQRVVLVLHEAPDRVERRLVLQRPVQDRAPELVPAVGANVVLRVELREDLALSLRPRWPPPSAASGVEPPNPPDPPA